MTDILKNAYKCIKNEIVNFKIWRFFWLEAFVWREMKKHRARKNNGVFKHGEP